VKSILDLLSTIMSNPYINAPTKTRARFLRQRLGGQGYGFFGDIFGDIFGGAR